MSEDKNILLNTDLIEYISLAKDMLFDKSKTKFETIKALESEGLERNLATEIVNNLKNNKEVKKEYDQKAFYFGLSLLCFGLFLRIFLNGLFVYGIIGFGIFLMLKNMNSFNNKPTE